MGECEEVTKNDGGGKQQQRQQRGEMLRLNAYPDSDGYTINNQGVIDDSRTCFVHVLMEIKIDDACHEKDEDKCIKKHVTNFQLRIVVCLEGDDLLTVNQKVFQRSSQHSDAPIEPIGQHHCQDRSDAASKGKSTKVALNEPINKNEP